MILEHRKNEDTDFYAHLSTDLGIDDLQVQIWSP